MKPLTGQVAIVTGAASGIGFGIATVLRGEGAEVVVADKDAGRAEAAAEQLGEHALAVAVDVTDPAGVTEMAAVAVERGGGGVMLATQACLPQMTRQGYGRVVITSSITGSVTGQPGYAHYGATKAALLGLMRTAALEVAGAGITINAVLPGNIRTAGFDGLGPEHARQMLAAIPLGRVGDPVDVGWAVRFLAAPEAGYITGQTLIIDGGQILPEGIG